MHETLSASDAADMPGPARGARLTLAECLFREPYRFDFFQAVRVLERRFDERRRQEAPGSGAVGQDWSPEQEAVRFRSTPSLGFPGATVREVREPAVGADVSGAQAPPEMLVSFLGLTGPNGALPDHYTLLLIERARAKDYTLRDFLDLFNHRTISLFYRAWEKYRFPLGYERRQRAPQGEALDRFSECLFALVGLATGGLQKRLRFDDEAFLFYAGHFSRVPRPAAALEQLLEDYFQLPVRVMQFQGQWMYLADDERSIIPGRRHPQGQNCELGVNLVLGERGWGVEHRFRLQIGPLSYRQFMTFIPSGEALVPFCQMARSFVGVEYEFDVQLVLRGDEAPWCQLGGESAPRLGWNTWVRADAFPRDVADAVFSDPSEI